MYPVILELHRDLCQNVRPSKKEGKIGKIEELMRAIAGRLQISGAPIFFINWDGINAQIIPSVRAFPMDPLWLKEQREDLSDAEFIKKVSRKHPHMNKQAIKFCIDLFKNDRQAAYQMIKYGITRSLLPFVRDFQLLKLAIVSSMICVILYQRLFELGSPGVLLSFAAGIVGGFYIVSQDNIRPEIESSFTAAAKSNWRKYQTLVQSTDKVLHKE